MKKRLLSIVFALLMLCQLLSFSILAEPAYDEDNETPGIGWENVYDVTLPEAPVGYTITVAEGSSTTVEEGGSFSFTVEVLDGYNGDAMVVTAGETVLEAIEGVYTIENITANQTITVTGVEEAEPEGIAGDIDGNGRITTADIRTLRQYRAGYEDLTLDEAALDVDGNGRVTTADIRLLRQYRAGYEGLTLYYNGKVAATT